MSAHSVSTNNWKGLRLMVSIAHVTQHFLPIGGGQEVYIHNLNQVFKKADLFTTVYQPDRGMKAEHVVCIPRIKYIAWFFPFWDEYFFIALLNALKRPQLKKADIIISHYASLASLFPRDILGKVIILSHGIEWNVDRMNWNDRLHEWNAKRLFDKTTLVANDTDYLRRFGLDVKPGTAYFDQVAPGKWFIPNCIDVDIFKRCNPVAELAGEKNILVPRQIVADRGVDLAIKAFALFAEQKDGYYLRIIGKAPERRYLKKCKDLVRELGLQDTVTFHAAVSNWEMPQYYSSAELTLIPSWRREGTSLSALESMACGTATVSTNIGGLKDLPTVQAFADEKSLATAMLATVENARRVSASQQAFVRKTFNMRNWSCAWLAVVNSVLKSAGDSLLFCEV